MFVRGSSSPFLNLPRTNKEKTMNNTTNEQTGEEKVIYGIFTPEEVKVLHDDYKLTRNPNVALTKIAAPMFRKHQIRSWDEANDQLKLDIQTAFFNIQTLVVTKDVTKTMTVEHKKGDVMRDENGNPLTDGTDQYGSPRFKLYTKNTIEKQEVKVEKPFFDHTESPQALRDLERRLRAIEVLPDYDELRKTYLKDVDFERGCELIRNLTNYYIFEDPDTFVDRFALLICNAKSKALGYHPKWPVLFSLVGKMGVGKSWLADMVKTTHDKTFSCRSGVTSYNRLLDGQFNAMMMTRGFLTLDEAQGLDKTQCEKLKTYITSKTVDIERKGMDVKTCDNLVTFFSSTNESVKDVMGYQPDRRIVEFTIKEKKGEIPESDIVAWLNEIWRVMPIEHPRQQEIKDDLLKASSDLNDENMGDVVFEIVKNGSDSFTNSNGKVNLYKLKTRVKELGGVPFVRVRDWCLDQSIFTKDKRGQIYLSKRGLNNFLGEHDQPMKATKNDVVAELDELLKVEG